jgi:hypothetical protein
MPRRGPDDPEDEDETGEDGRDGRRGALLRLVLVLMLVLGGLLLVHELRDMSRLQDCVMSGRTNCAPISVAPAR